MTLVAAPCSAWPSTSSRGRGRRDDRDDRPRPDPRRLGGRRALRAAPARPAAELVQPVRDPAAGRARPERERPAGRPPAPARAAGPPGHLPLQHRARRRRRRGRPRRGATAPARARRGGWAQPAARLPAARLPARPVPGPVPPDLPERPRPDRAADRRQPALPRPRADARRLPALAGLLARSRADARYGRASQRAAIERAIELYRWKGTRRGLREELRLRTGTRPLIVENFDGLRLGQDAALGMNSQLGTPRPGRHRRHAGRDGSVDDERLARAAEMIEELKPAHVGHVVRVVSARA